MVAGFIGANTFGLEKVPQASCQLYGCTNSMKERQHLEKLGPGQLSVGKIVRKQPWSDYIIILSSEPKLGLSVVLVSLQSQSREIFQDAFIFGLKICLHIQYISHKVQKFKRQWYFRKVGLL